MHFSHKRGEIIGFKINLPLRFLMLQQNTMTKEQVGEERVYLAYLPHLCASSKEVRIRTQT